MLVGGMRAAHAALGLRRWLRCRYQLPVSMAHHTLQHEHPALSAAMVSPMGCCLSPSCHNYGVLMALCTATHSFEPQNLSLLDRRHSQLGVCNSQGQLPTALMQWMRPSHPCRRSGGVWVSVSATAISPLTRAVPLVGVAVVAPQQSWLPEALQGDANSSSSVLRAATSTAGDNATERRLRGSTRNQPFRAGGLAPEAGISDTDASDDAAAKLAVELCDQSLFTTDPHSLLKVRSLRSFCDNPNALCAHYHHAVTGVYWPRRSLRAWRQG